MQSDLWSLSPRDREIHVGLTYPKFKNSIDNNLELLEKLSNRDVLNQIAWLARNLLELLVWVRYCASSMDRAWEFWEDSIRDLNSLVDPADKHDPAFLARLAKATSMLGTQKEPRAWKRVSKAASAVKQTNYEEHNQAFSKFVHPTAMSILLGLSSSGRRTIQKRFVEEGIGFASEAKEKLEASLMAAFYSKYKSSIQRVLATPEGKRVGFTF